MGGQTEGMTGVAAAEGGFGGTRALGDDGGNGDGGRERREQGYGGERDMDRNVGA